MWRSTAADGPHPTPTNLSTGSESSRIERSRRGASGPLETFSALRAAAHLYTGAGFVLDDAEQRMCWGREIDLRRYALDLG